MLKEDLLTLIERKRTELIQVASLNGLTSSIAIRYSQELDHLLNEYNRIFIKKLPHTPNFSWESLESTN